MSKAVKLRCLNCGKLIAKDNDAAVCDEDCFYENIYKRIDWSKVGRKR